MKPTGKKDEKVILKAYTGLFFLTKTTYTPTR
jgi:hypothetical protein